VFLPGADVSAVESGVAVRTCHGGAEVGGQKLRPLEVAEIPTDPGTYQQHHCPRVRQAVADAPSPIEAAHEQWGACHAEQGELVAGKRRQPCEHPEGDCGGELRAPVHPEGHQHHGCYQWYDQILGDHLGAEDPHAREERSGEGGKGHRSAPGYFLRDGSGEGDGRSRHHCQERALCVHAPNAEQVA